MVLCADLVWELDEATGGSAWALEEGTWPLERRTAGTSSGGACGWAWRGGKDVTKEDSTSVSCLSGAKIKGGPLAVDAAEGWRDAAEGG